MSPETAWAITAVLLATAIIEITAIATAKNGETHRLTPDPHAAASGTM